jgi:geranylgeranyl diphosphate synthase type II
VTINQYLADRVSAVNAALERLLPPETQYPETIHSAMRHSVFAGGKRIRPVLFLAATEAVLPSAEGAEPAACALELVHTYSLIHDDLPALDNDDFRRGKPTCHKVYGEAMAILAGDALLTLAFQVLSDEKTRRDASQVRLVAELATAAGTVNGMIGGQVADLEAEGKAVDGARLDYIHRSKTGALIGASVRMGGIYADADAEQLAALGRYGEHIGLAFQIVDDILDVVGNFESLGKTAGKDAAQRKATFPALYGLEASRERAQEHFQQATEALEVFGEHGLRLRQIAEKIVQRSS